jgi:hypothetical protein
MLVLLSFAYFIYTLLSVKLKSFPMSLIKPSIPSKVYPTGQHFLNFKLSLEPASLRERPSSRRGRLEKLLSLIIIVVHHMTFIFIPRLSSCDLIFLKSDDRLSITLYKRSVVDPVYILANKAKYDSLVNLFSLQNNRLKKCFSSSLVCICRPKHIYGPISYTLVANTRYIFMVLSN